MSLKNYFNNWRIGTTIFVIIVALNVFYIFYHNHNPNNCLGGALELGREQEESLVDDGSVRHCITDAVLGRIENAVKEENFVPVFEGFEESTTDRSQSFKNVFDGKLWGKFSNVGLSSSGYGSTIEFTHEITGVLHKVANDLKKLKGPNSRISILDVPCGDFVWMSRFLSSRDDIDYTGMDIVPDLIELHKLKYPNNNWTFIKQDVVVAGYIGNYDIIICRMMMQHLYNNDVMRVLNVFSNNSNGLLITTTFSGKGLNLDLSSLVGGRFRYLNLEIPPFSLTPPICVAKDGPPSYATEEFIGIWKLPLMRVSNCSTPHKFRMDKFNHTFFSCTNWIL